MSNQNSKTGAENWHRYHAPSWPLKSWRWAYRRVASPSSRRDHQKLTRGCAEPRFSRGKVCHLQSFRREKKIWLNPYMGQSLKHLLDLFGDSYHLIVVSLFKGLLGVHQPGFWLVLTHSQKAVWPVTICYDDFKGFQKVRVHLKYQKNPKEMTQQSLLSPTSPVFVVLESSGEIVGLRASSFSTQIPRPSKRRKKACRQESTREKPELFHRWK